MDAPAADMTYSFGSMNDSFFMTNISPQIPGCNRGIWLRVENRAFSLTNGDFDSFLSDIGIGF